MATKKYFPINKQLRNKNDSMSAIQKLFIRKNMSDDEFDDDVNSNPLELLSVVACQASNDLEDLDHVDVDKKINLEDLDSVYDHPEHQFLV